VILLEFVSRKCMGRKNVCAALSVSITLFLLAFI
jgi:hypothetical protein